MKSHSRSEGAIRRNPSAQMLMPVNLQNLQKSFSVKEKQESMVPRAVRQACTPSSSVRRLKKVLNVSVLNQKYCSLIADYSSCSDGEEEVSKTKKKKEKKENENKIKKKLTPFFLMREIKCRWNGNQLDPRFCSLHWKCSRRKSKSPIPKTRILRKNLKLTRKKSKTINPKNGLKKSPLLNHAKTLQQKIHVLMCLRIKKAER